MFCDDEIFSEYLEYLKEFHFKFKKFLKTRPCNIKVSTTPDTIIIFDFVLKKQKAFIIDITVSVKDLIYQIELYLKENIYPVMIEEEISYNQLNKKEIEEYIKKGYKLNDFLGKRKEIVKTIKHRIEKIYLLKNIVFVRNLDNNEYRKYKLYIPYSLFFNKYIKKGLNKDAFECFKLQSKLLKNLTGDNLL